ncbi:MAG TPA: zf-HC2 domain-containing protein [Chloroflexota bacterium]|nr:zf-HC2 domain-containing protein [Chloroflexota bacterium]
MGCVDSGELRAFLDGELTGAARARVQVHLAGCGGCRSELEALRANASVAQSAFDLLAPSTAEMPRLQWSQIRDRAEDRRDRPVTRVWGLNEMFAGFLRFAGGSRVRMATSSIAAVVVVALVFTLSPVQTMASSFLSIFRVQKFVAVQVDPSAMKKFEPPADMGKVTGTGSGTTVRAANQAEAEKITGLHLPLPAKVPAGLAPTPRAFTVTETSSFTYTPDLKKLRAYLSSIGASNVKLPDNLDGAPITMQMPPTEMATYLEPDDWANGSVRRDEDGKPVPSVGQKFLYVGATTSPSLSVPDGLDVEQIRNELLKIPGLPTDMVGQLRSISDWRSTMVVPVVKGSTREVTVQGQTGLMISQRDGTATSIIWPNNGAIYAVSGSYSEAEMLAVANSLK